MKPIYDAVKLLLVERGWHIDENAVERPDGELHEFVHPVTGAKMAWIDAVLEEHGR